MVVRRNTWQLGEVVLVLVLSDLSEEVHTLLDSGDGQSPPNMEIVAVHCRAGFSPISVTQKTKLVFCFPQTKY